MPIRHLEAQNFGGSAATLSTRFICMACVHLHGVHFQVANSGWHGRHQAEVSWKDTVALNAHQRVELLIPFTASRGRYVFHCHNLEHEDMAMMANFEVI
jgi:spore coat protein A, manganese oxidase